MEKTTDSLHGSMMNIILNADKNLHPLSHWWQSKLLHGQESSLKSLVPIKGKPLQGETGLTFINKETKLTKEILDLLSESEKLRNQISLLEDKEAKISEKITIKRRQIETYKLFEGN